MQPLTQVAVYLHGCRNLANRSERLHKRPPHRLPVGICRCGRREPGCSAWMVARRAPRLRKALERLQVRLGAWLTLLNGPRLVTAFQKRPAVQKNAAFE